MLSEKDLNHVKESKRMWSKVHDSSAPGTLAYSESTVALKSLEEIKILLEKKNAKSLSEKELEEIVGGGMEIRALALTLAFSAMSSLVHTPGVPVVGATSTTQNVISKKINSKFKEFKKSYPKLSQATAVLTVTGVGVGINLGVAKGILELKALLQYQFQEVFDLDRIAALVYSLDDEAIQEAVMEQIKVYIGRAPKIFSIDNDVVEKSNPHMLLLILLRMNHIFEKYKSFTEKFISLKYYQGEKFNIHIHANPKKNIVACISLNELLITEKFLSGSIKDWEVNSRADINKGFHSSVEKNMFVDSYIVHEMGHLIQYTELGSLTGIFLNSEGKMKSNILKDAEEKYGNANRVISTYGEENAAEFFAEAFAHYECSKEENLNSIGKAMRDYMVKWR